MFINLMCRAEQTFITLPTTRPQTYALLQSQHTFTHTPCIALNTYQLTGLFLCNVLPWRQTAAWSFHSPTMLLVNGKSVSKNLIHQDSDSI